MSIRGCEWPRALFLVASFLILAPQGSFSARLMYKFKTDEGGGGSSRSDWACGIGPVSGKLSYLLSYFTKTKDINQCCHEHDELLYDMSLQRSEVDRVFCNCLDTIGTTYTRFVIHPIFCASVKIYTLFYPDDRTHVPSSATGVVLPKRLESRKLAEEIRHGQPSLLGGKPERSRLSEFSEEVSTESASEPPNRHTFFPDFAYTKGPAVYRPTPQPPDYIVDGVSNERTPDIMYSNYIGERSPNIER